MNLSKKRTIIHFVLFIGILSLISCASDPVQFNLPLDHPANPRAPEAIFTPPLNPFVGNVLSAVPQADQETKMTHNAHGAPEKDQAGHQMEPMQMKQKSKQMPSSTNEEKENRHMENHQ